MFQLPPIHPARRNTLIAASIASKVLIWLVGLPLGFWAYFLEHTNYSLHLYDLWMYYWAVTNVFHGMWPWTNGVEFYYPPLAFVPMLIAYVNPLPGSFLGFVLGMWVLMAACDVVTTLCIYYIGLKLYSEQKAFIAAMLNATAFSVAYYVLTRFDSFPAALALVAVLATIYGYQTRGYLGAVTGFFVKLWPMLLFPFLWLYNARESTVLVEGRKRAIWFLLGGGLAFGLMLWAGYNKFLVYASWVYCNTIPYTLFQYLQMAGMVVPFNTVVNMFRILTGAVIIGAWYWMYKRSRSITTMLKLILITIFVVIFFSQYRSPQYIVWLTPFAALLVAEDIWGILAFYGVQVLAFIEFPITYGVLWYNDRYISNWALGFFTVFFIAYGLLVWRAVSRRDTGERPIVFTHS